MLLPFPNNTCSRASSVWEIGLADVYRKVKSTEITNANVTDTRYDTDRCGIISSISEFDTTTLYQQVQADLEEFRNVSQEEFNVWVENFQTEFEAYQTEKQNEFSQWSEDFQAEMEEYKTAKEEELNQWTENFQSELEEFKNTEQTEYQTWEQETHEKAESFQAASEEEFNSWFDSMKDKLTEDQAGNLQAQIDEIAGKIVCDETLTVKSAPADAKAVGDAIANINTNIQSENITLTKGLGEWLEGTIGGMGILRKVAYGNGIFVAVGDDYNHSMIQKTTAYYSADGITWTACGSFVGDMGLVSNYTPLYGVVYGKDKFVAVSNNGNAYYSTDGIEWTGGSGTSGTLCDVTYGNDTFVTIDSASGAVYYSTDGITWTAGSGTGGTLKSVAYGNSKFVAIAVDSDITTIYYSADGITWTACDAAISYTLNAVRYCKDKFIAVGNDGAVYYSTDAVAWTAGSGTSGALKSVAYGNDIFVAIAYDSTASATITYCSDDGITWNSGDNIGSSCLDITFGNDMFVTVGNTVTTTPVRVSYYIDAFKKEITKFINTVTMIRKTLHAGGTEILFKDSRITENTLFSFYTSIYGVNPTAVTAAAGSVTLTFDAQETDMEVGVRIDG